LAEDDETAVGTHFRDCCIFGDFARTRQHRPCNLSGEDAFLGSAFSDGTIVIALLL
jgi:hypothetical protein